MTIFISIFTVSEAVFGCMYKVNRKRAKRVARISFEGGGAVVSTRSVRITYRARIAHSLGGWVQGGGSYHPPLKRESFDVSLHY